MASGRGTCGRGGDEARARAGAGARGLRGASSGARRTGRGGDAQRDRPRSVDGQQIFVRWCVPCHGAGPGHPGTQALAVKYHGNPAGGAGGAQRPDGRGGQVLRPPRHLGHGAVPQDRDQRRGTRCAGELAYAAACDGASHPLKTRSACQNPRGRWILTMRSEDIMQPESPHRRRRPRDRRGAQARPRQGRRLRQRRHPARQVHGPRQVLLARSTRASASATWCWAGTRTTSSTTT